MIDFKARIAELSTKAGREAHAKKMEESRQQIEARYIAKAQSQKEMAKYLYELLQTDCTIEFADWEKTFIKNMEYSTSREEFTLTDKQDEWLTKLYEKY